MFSCLKDEAREIALSACSDIVLEVPKQTRLEIDGAMEWRDFFLKGLNVSTPVGTPNLSMQVMIITTYLDKIDEIAIAQSLTSIS